MCTMCQALDPSLTVYDPHVDPLTDGGVEGTVPATLSYSMDEIAGYLTDDFVAGEDQQAWTFDVPADGVVTVNLDGLDAADRAAVLEALDDWAAETGLSFVEAPEAMITFDETETGGYTIAWQPDAGIAGPEAMTGVAAGGATMPVGATAASKPVYSVDQIADYLADGFWADNGMQARSFNVQAGGTITVNINGLDALGKATALQALEAWTAVTGLTFTQSSSAMITFDDNQAGAYNSSSTSGTTIIASNVNVHTSWQGYGDYYLQTYIHEIGHALGLGHGGLYNGSADYNSQAHYANDSWQMSVMSYFSNNENPNVSASFAYLATAQMADIVAIQSLYGTPTDIETGNSIYGDNTNLTQYGMGLDTGKAVTIFDSGGIDMIDLGSRWQNQRIDLQAEAFSDMNGKTGNLAIARGALIENLRTGSGVDHITGNTADNTLESGAGDDTILGQGGNDILVGGAGADTLTGGTGGDVFVYGAANEAGDTITDFSLSQGDRIDLSGLFAALGYDGGDPVGDGMVWLAAATGGSWLMVNGGGLGALAMAFLTGIASTASVADIIDVDSVPVGPDPDAYDTVITLTNAFVQNWTEEASIIRDTNGGNDTLDPSAVTYGSRIYLDGTPGKVGSKALTIEAGSDIENLLLGSGSDYGYGSDLNNEIDGGKGNDYLYGRAGDDLLIGGLGNDKLYGDAGDDVITGDTGNDYLYGGDGGDDLSGGDGNDRIYGEGDDDVIRSGAGNDYLYGGYGGDDLTAGEGNDRLYGDEGDDLLRGDAGSDYLYGGDGDDDLDGGEGNDKVYGDAGDDVITGGGGNDYLYGHDGDDALVGGDGNDRIYGDDGSDTMDGGAGNDTIYGGLGNDVIDAGNGTDKLYGHEGDDELAGGAGNDTLYGHDGDDTMSGGADADKLYGGAGNDVMTAGDGKDYLKGEDGDDRLDGGEGVDKLYGGDGDDYLDAGDGNDMLYGDNGDDVIHGGAGDDKIYGKYDHDTMYGGDGLDYIKGDKGDDYADGGAGNDKIYGDNGFDELHGGDGDDYIKAGNDADYVTGGAGIDKIYGDNGDDTVFGGDGDDYIKLGNDDDYAEGGTGNDTIYGDGGLDQLFGGDGDDYLKAGNDADHVEGGAGIDTIFGDNGDDTILGGAGADIINGGGGNDVITGGAGADEIKGGSGADVFVFTALDEGGDYLSDFKLTDDDRISVSGLLGGGSVADALANELFALVADGKNSMLTFDTGAGVVDLAYIKNLSADTVLSEDWLI